MGVRTTKACYQELCDWRMSNHKICLDIFPANTYEAPVSFRCRVFLCQQGCDIVSGDEATVHVSHLPGIGIQHACPSIHESSEILPLIKSSLQHGT